MKKARNVYKRAKSFLRRHGTKVAVGLAAAATAGTSAYLASAYMQKRREKQALKAAEAVQQLRNPIGNPIDEYIFKGENKREMLIPVEQYDRGISQYYSGNNGTVPPMEVKQMRKMQPAPLKHQLLPKIPLRVDDFYLTDDNFEEITF